jgi:DtxR family Mn-dependent transcriptional regulator
MTEPGFALLAFGLLVVVLALLLWPRHGIVSRLLRLSRLDERVRLEDALKHVFTCQRGGQTCSLESLAGSLSVSTARAASLLSRLAEMGLVRTGGAGPVLTEDGTQSALRIVRTHRLWERYLADRTGIPPGEWHDHAERMEHALSDAQVDDLASRLGHPRWDPHGDPIPTSAGDIPPLRGVGLVATEPGELVEIVHLEDEPREIYDALIKDGLALGSRLEIVERTDRAVRVRAGGSEWTLDPVTARNVTVRHLAAGEPVEPARPTLADARPGETVRVLGISATCQGTQRRRLMDLGVVRGTEITAELVSAAGDPVAYRIRGALIALRQDQAARIQVERAGRGHAQAVA